MQSAASFSAFCNFGFSATSELALTRCEHEILIIIRICSNSTDITSDRFQEIADALNDTPEKHYNGTVISDSSMLARPTRQVPR